MTVKQLKMKLLTRLSQYYDFALINLLKNEAEKLSHVNFTTILRAAFWYCAKLFCTYILGLNFFGVMLLAQMSL